MTDAYLTINTLGFATGTVLFVLLLALARKADRLTGGLGGAHWGSGAAAGALLWNAGNLIVHALMLAGFDRTSLGCRLADAFAWSATALLPTAFLLLFQPAQWTRSWQPRANRWLRFISLANAVWLTLGFFAVSLIPDFPLRFNLFMKLSAYNLAAHVAAAVVVFRAADQATPAGRTFARTMTLWAVGLVVSLMVLIHLELPASVAATLGIAAQQSSLPAAILAFARLAQFRFADVFVKRSLTILTAVAVALVYALLVVEPLVEAVRVSTPKPTAGAWIVATILWCALLLVFPGLERAVNRAADRWLFRRPDYRRLVQAFSWEVEPLETEEEVFTLAEERIQTALGVAAVHAMTSDHLTAGASPTEEVGAIVPIQVNAASTHALVITSGERSRKLLSDEMAFLQAMTERIGRKIESLQFQRERRERELREARLQHMLTEAELKALRAQVNPHFLFNTLNTIADLISSEPEKAEAMTERLAEVFRSVLARTDHNLIPISEEFEFLRTYLEIEQARFGDRLRVELTAEPSVLSEPIPSLLLQPLVENAVKHGLAPKLGGGTLRVRAVDEAGFVRFVVEDDGVGWVENKKTFAVAEASDSLRHEGGPVRQLVAGLRDETLNNVAGPGGVGLRNVAERLRTLYGDRAQLTVRSVAGQGTSVSILVPKDA